MVIAAGKGERQPWDFGRFFQTVLYFNPPPPPQEVLRSLVQQPLTILKALSGQATLEDRKSAVLTLIAPRVMAGSGPQPGSEAGSALAAGSSGSQGVVMVTGATGGVGKRVVARLLAGGCRVRALVRDPEKARSLLSSLPASPGGSLELVAGDITQSKTLLPEMFDGVRAVVSCTAVKVAPKEGDSVDRTKYYQGIKFYDPEIVGDTPEAVEYVGMQNLLGVVKDKLGSSSGKVVWAADGSGQVQGWGSLDDVVMGGVSQSGFFVQQGAGEHGGPAGLFAGNVTSDNNGGFASVRTRNLEPPLDLGAYEGLELRLKGDGLRYKCVIRCDSGWDSVVYTTSFDTQPCWQTIRLPFTDFLPVFRARTMRDMAAINPANVCSIQLMLSKFETDGKLNPTFREGRFELPVERIAGYMPEPLVPRFVLVSSAGVTRPDRPGINVDEEPPAVKMNDMLGGILTYKLKAEDALRSSGVPFAIVRPVALTEEPEGMPLRLEQGDTVRGKVSREDVAELCVQLLSQPAGLDTTFEVASTVPFSQPWTVDPASPPAPRDWAALLEGAELKQRVTGKTVGGRYLGKEPEPLPTNSSTS